MEATTICVLFVDLGAGGVKGFFSRFSCFLNEINISSEMVSLRGVGVSGVRMLFLECFHTGKF